MNMPVGPIGVRRAGLIAAALLASTSLLAGCSSLGGSGPSTGQIAKAGQQTLSSAQIQVIPLDEQVARRVTAANASGTFADTLGDSRAVGSLVGPGDVLQVSIWEAPPALLFGGSMLETRSSSASNTGTFTLPEQMVDRSGLIAIPYAGVINVNGRSTRQIEKEITRRLDGKAHLPQAIVRIARNATANVTVMGDVASSARVPLSAKGERLLDVLAAVGGSRQPVTKTTIQITRGSTVVTMPLEKVSRDPRQNIVMQADDVVSVVFQPYSFTSLGAVGNNAEIPFEGTGLTLSQALGRIGGLRDDRADVRGVFIFRLEDPAALAPEMVGSAKQTVEGKVPVIYRVDLRDPASFFIAQGFPILNHDVLYVSNAQATDLQKFVNIISSMSFSILGIKNSI